MKAVIQKVKQASVSINNEIHSSIGNGLLVLVAVHKNDNDEIIQWFSNKLINLRVFPDEFGIMNKSVLDVNGEILLVSNFTVYACTKKGFRPSYSNAASPSISEPLYNELLDYLKSNYTVPIKTGVFGAMMDVALINDGPVTIIIDKEA